MFHLVLIPGLVTTVGPRTTSGDVQMCLTWYFSLCRNYLSSVLIQEIFLTWDHDDLSMRAKVSAKLHEISISRSSFFYTG